VPQTNPREALAMVDSRFIFIQPAPLPCQAQQGSGGAVVDRALQGSEPGAAGSLQGMDGTAAEPKCKSASCSDVSAYCNMTSSSDRITNQQQPSKSSAPTDQPGKSHGHMALAAGCCWIHLSLARWLAAS
jgi:hypothetical protein